MDDVRDSFRSSVAGWLGGTLAGWGTIVLVVGGFAAMIAAAGDWGAWPLLLTALGLAIVAFKWFEAMSAKYEVTDERLIVRRGTSPFPMVRLPGHSFYRTLRDKLGWGAAPPGTRGASA